RLQPRPLRPGHRLQRDLRPARGRRADARVLPRQGADEGDDRARAAQELPSGVAAGLGLHDLRGAEARACPAHVASDQGADVKKAFFGPFKVSAMLDSNGCNTTAATAVAKLAKEVELTGRVVIVGAGAVGLRAAALLEQEGCDVTISGIPADRFGADYRRARG